MNNIELPKSVQKKVDGIKFDNTSGSAELSEQAAETLVLLTQEEEKDFKKKLEATCYQLYKAQPSMASVFNLVNNVMLLVKKDRQNLDKVVQSYCKSFIKNVENSALQIAKNFKQLFENGFTVLTHSYSSTILNSLLTVNEKMDFDVICTESRPMYEGRKLAGKLGEDGVDVRLIVDSAAFLFLKEADVIVVGCDAVSSRGVLNKIGTSGLAIAAKKLEIPCYVLCSHNKILPQDFNLEEEEKKDSDEIISKKIKNVSPVNYYFEYTDLDLFNSFVTEKGLQSKKEIKRQMKKRKVHPVFR